MAAVHSKQALGLLASQDKVHRTQIGGRMLTYGGLTRLCHARDILRERCHADMPIAEVAKVAAMSQHHFIRQFKAVFGETPHQFRTRSRLDLAKRLLVVGEESISDICLEIGYSSLGSFSTLFARRFGQAPSKFRQRLAGSVDEITPHCMELLRTAWEKDSQFSRSEDASGKGNLTTPDQEPNAHENQTQ